MSVMKNFLLILSFPIFAASDCGNNKHKEIATIQEAKDKKINVTDSIPPCVRSFIDSSFKHSPEDAPVRIDEYWYKDQQFYLFMAPCCDNFDILYDKNCKEICAPTGGFSGRGDGRCPDFSKEAKLVRTIWNNELKR
jgi:hypothetical protein